MSKRSQLLFLAMMLCGTICIAGEAKRGLRLVLEIDKSNHATHQAVVVNYWVTNLSKREISIPGHINADYGHVKFEIARQGSRFEPYRTGPQVRASVSPVTLKQNDRLSGQVVIVTNAYGLLARTNLRFSGVKLFPFSEPGIYRLRATYPIERPDSSGKGSVLSSPSYAP